MPGLLEQGREATRRKGRVSLRRTDNSENGGRAINVRSLRVNSEVLLLLLVSFFFAVVVLWVFVVVVVFPGVLPPCLNWFASIRWS